MFVFNRCAKARCEQDWSYVFVCVYGPGGNFDTTNSGAYFAYPYKKLEDLPAPRPNFPSFQPRTSTTTTTTVATTRYIPFFQVTTPRISLPNPSPPSGDFTTPKRGSQCRYGLSYPHSLCLNDSPYLLWLEPTSKSEVLNRHNDYRMRVSPRAKNMPMVQWDDDLAVEAERWAAQCKFEHNAAGNRGLPARGQREAWAWVGQNLCWSSGFNQTWTNCIDDWGSESRNWMYGMGPTYSGAVVGHYTQMIWEETLYIGCAKSRCRRQDTNGEENHLVCHYGPGGNVARRNGESPFATPYSRA